MATKLHFPHLARNTAYRGLLFKAQLLLRRCVLYSCLRFTVAKKLKRNSPSAHSRKEKDPCWRPNEGLCFRSSCHHLMTYLLRSARTHCILPSALASVERGW